MPRRLRGTRPSLGYWRTLQLRRCSPRGCQSRQDAAVVRPRRTARKPVVAALRGCRNNNEPCSSQELRSRQGKQPRRAAATDANERESEQAPEVAEQPQRDAATETKRKRAGERWNSGSWFRRCPDRAPCSRWSRRTRSSCKPPTETGGACGSSITCKRARCRTWKVGRRWSIPRPLSDLTVGSIVLCQSYRNPGQLANMAATLQFLSRGKLVFGIGAGWKEDEYLAYDYAFPEPKVRLDQLEEALQVIKALWTGERVTVTGKHYRVTDAIALPAPDPLPPIMIGGNGNRTVGIAAREADWWNADLATPELFKEKVALLRDKSVAAGRAADAVRPTAFNMLSLSADPDKVMRTPPREGIHMIAGTPDEVRDQLREYEAAGVDYMQINFMDFPDTEAVGLFEDVAAEFGNRK
ncbi:MAG: LLM class flavin-dependent oxidoreductase [Thermomicrobiales bacterium]